jgi:co-chaperonin GroES (HSP10)
MKMIPTGDYLLLEKQEESKTASGIILTGKENTLVHAKVVATGPGIFTQTGDRIKMDIQKGQTVVTRADLLQGRSNQIDVEGNKYYLVRASEILMADVNG